LQPADHKHIERRRSAIRSAQPKGGGPLMRWDVINALLSAAHGRKFLEIGVQAGVCGARVRATEKWGVDPEARAGASNGYARFFHCGSDEFFAQLDPTERFDVVMVDGLHHADQVERDTINALRHLAPGGAIVLHDCNPLTELAQRVPRATGVWNGDCWKAMVRLRARGDVDAFTINSDHGIGVVRPRRVVEPLRDMPDLTWDVLDADRERLLGLVEPARWLERIGEPFSIGRVVLLSAVFGGRDIPAPVPAGTGITDAVLFTDCIEPQHAPGWRVIRNAKQEDPRMAARRIKTLALELVDADVVLWVDGRIRLTGVPVRPLLEQVLAEDDIAGFPHPWRDCTYTEARQCGELGLAPVADLEVQTEAYRADGLPAHGGLWNTMVLARRNTPAMVELGRAWWDEIQRHTVRDQVSLPYLLWRDGIRCERLGRDVYHAGASPHFERGRHAT
jgi:SAM-dependent methyltransferase